MQITITIPTPLSVLRAWRETALIALAAAFVLPFSFVDGGARASAATA